MRTFIPAVLAITIFIQVKAQETSRADIQSLVNAERSFIQMAKEKNTRDAFLAFLADDAVTFGNEPRIGKEYLHKQAPNESWLSWEPVYSDISSSGNFGFNTGPWEYRNKRGDEKAVAFGQFVTVWIKINGEWKAAIDMGISHEQPVQHEKWKSSTIISKETTKGPGASSSRGVPEIEKEFIKNFIANGYSAYKDKLSSDGRIYRGGSEPKVTGETSRLFLEGIKSVVTFNPLDGRTSSGGDMAFVYGKCTIGVDAVRQTYYLRIWKKEGDTWKIVLDLVQ